MTSRERFELGPYYAAPEHRVYFNSTNLDGPELAQATASAEEQNAKVLRIMQTTRRPMTPWDVWDAGLDGPMSSWWLIGSVRRAMTTMSDGEAPVLVKLPTKRHSGPRGRLCYEWALPEDRQNG